MTVTQSEIFTVFLFGFSSKLEISVNAEKKGVLVAWNDIQVRDFNARNNDTYRLDDASLSQLASMFMEGCGQAGQRTA